MKKYFSILLKNLLGVFLFFDFSMGCLHASETKNETAVNFYQPVHATGIRAPAVPIILSDPYLSIWSPYDNLTAGNTQHWTGADHPVIGAIRVDGTTYRFMGKDKPHLELITKGDKAKPFVWKGAYTFDKPIENWTDVSFDDTKWKRGRAPFGTRDIRGVRTRWETKDIWVRRTFDLAEDFSAYDIYLQYSHDDVFELYLNGEKLVATDYSWKNNQRLLLSEEQKKKLRREKNVIAAHCHNTTGGGYVDFALYKRIPHEGFDNSALQTAVHINATSSYYSFVAGNVALDLVFTSPLLPTDLDLISTPVNYISYCVSSLDEKEHDVQIYFETTSELAVNDITQYVRTERIEKNNFVYLKAGTKEQPITKREGDGVRIDWGYAYLASDIAAGKQLLLGDYYDLKNMFLNTGVLETALEYAKITAQTKEDLCSFAPVLAYTDNLGKVSKNGNSGFLMLGYDDVYSVEYFHKRLHAYWKHNGKIDIYQAFERAHAGYAENRQKAREFDKLLWEDAMQASDNNKEYAELCALTYRQAVAAHKLLQSDNGDLLFLSKENHSGGFINTVDVTYPSAPLFLVYNPNLLKGMLNGIFHYSESGRWSKPYPAHDLGHYPNANGQRYGEDMPVEEAGNMILLATAISVVEGNAGFANKHWETLTTWANFLKEKGLDPGNQLCTDDFAGHLAHNANLSIKAILAVAGYGKMAQMLNKQTIAEDCLNEAKRMAQAWIPMAKDGNHYKLAFDRPGTWSQKYNLIWDKMLGMNIFDEEIAELEIPYYLKRQAGYPYGLPLDSRKDYTKSDWILWSACLETNNDTFAKFVSPIYRYANETQSRVPISDFYDANTGKMENFKARSVVGGFWMKVLKEKIAKNAL